MTDMHDVIDAGKRRSAEVRHFYLTRSGAYIYHLDHCGGCDAPLSYGIEEVYNADGLQAAGLVRDAEMPEKANWNSQGASCYRHMGAWNGTE